MTSNARRVTASGRDIAVIRLQDHRHAVFRHGDRESMRLLRALHRRPSRLTRLGLALLGGSAVVARVAEQARPAEPACRSRCAELFEAVAEFLDGDVVSYAATVNSAVEWAIIGVRRRADIVFVTVRTPDHPAIAEQATFLRDFENVCPPSVLIPRVVREGQAGGWSMLALTNLDPPDRTPEVELRRLLPYLNAMCEADHRDVTYAQTLAELETTGALAEPLASVLAGPGDADRTLRLCRAHGDFVPWNMALDGEALYLWDWSRAMRVAPWPFDAVHFCFQRRRHELHQSRETALAGARDDLAEVAGELGVARDPAALDRAIALYAAFRYAHELRVQLMGSDTVWLVENAL